MESFEHVCRVSLESRGYAVSTNVKFPVTRATRKTSYTEVQTHGYEVDLVGARADRLVLGEVKSYFGSQSLRGAHFIGLTGRPDTVHVRRLRVFNDHALRGELIEKAAARYGYDVEAVEFWLFAGNVSTRQEAAIRRHLDSLPGAVRLLSVGEIADDLVRVGSETVYLDDPVVTTVKALRAAGRIVGMA